MTRHLFAACFVLNIATLASTAVAQKQDDYGVLGSPRAPVEMTVYSDFECPYCRNFALAAMPAIVAEFTDRGLLRIRFVHFPLAGIHNNAVAAAMAAHCAAVAGRFWAYHDYLFVRQPEWSGEPAPDSVWISYAVNLFLDVETFSGCLGAPDTLGAVEADLRKALEAGATGTPTIVINDQALTGIGSFQELRQQILAAIEDARRTN